MVNPGHFVITKRKTLKKKSTAKVHSTPQRCEGECFVEKTVHFISISSDFRYLLTELPINQMFQLFRAVAYVHSNVPMHNIMHRQHSWMSEHGKPTRGEPHDKLVRRQSSVISDH